MTKVYNVSAKKLQTSYIWWHWRLMQNLKENSDFILEIKIVQLNQNENSKQPDRRDVEWNIFLTLKINEQHI